ncbi:protein GENOMES UNCOUPLED 4 [Wolffia australiana]
MATTAPLHPLRAPRQTHLRFLPFSSPPSSSLSFSSPRRSFSLLSASLSPPSSSSSSPSSSSSSLSTPSLSLLADLLSAGDFLRADDCTRRLLILLAGDQAQKRGYVFFSEVQFISADDLRAIDRLWADHSAGRFGYAAQRRAWEKARRDFTRFFVKVGWMKKLDTDVEQYNYRAFPEDFLWGPAEEAPEGHLPLTNALRGTQLLFNILTHPAFDDALGEQFFVPEVAKAEAETPDKAKSAGVRRLFRTDYSF